MFKKQYYAVVWAGAKRWSGRPVYNSYEAMMACFGMSSWDMHVTAIGSRKAEAIKKLREVPVLVAGRERCFATSLGCSRSTWATGAAGSSASTKSDQEACNGRKAETTS